ncbi:MAG: hypothetical protein AB1502_12475 [Thermodesulfobacteriota bacterium]
MVFSKKRKEKSFSSPRIIPFDGKSPQFDETVFIDPTARLIGDISLGPGVSVWPFALLRADSNPIVVGEQSALLDKVLIEAPQGHPVVIEREVLISHGAILRDLPFLYQRKPEAWRTSGKIPGDPVHPG